MTTATAIATAHEPVYLEFLLVGLRRLVVGHLTLRLKVLLAHGAHEHGNLLLAAFAAFSPSPAAEMLNVVA